MRRGLADAGSALLALQRRAAPGHPGTRLAQHAQRLDELEQRLLRQRRCVTQHVRCARMQGRLWRASPAQRLHANRVRHAQLRARLGAAASARLQAAKARLAPLVRALNAVSPLATLERGFAIVTLRESAGSLTDAGTLQPGERIHARLARGRVRSRVSRAVPETCMKFLAIIAPAGMAAPSMRCARQPLPQASSPVPGGIAVCRLAARPRPAHRDLTAASACCAARRRRWLAVVGLASGDGAGEITRMCSLIAAARSLIELRTSATSATPSSSSRCRRGR